MKTSLAIKTLFRTVGKTLFTFILIAVLTFSLFIQLAEYFKTAAEFKETVELYSGTGYVECRPAAYKGSNLGKPYYIVADPRMSVLDTPEFRELAGELVGDLVGDIEYPPLSAETVDQISSLPYISSVQKRYMTAGVSDRYMRMREDLIRHDYNDRIIVEGTLMVSWTYSLMEMAGQAIEYNYFLSDAKVLAGDAALDDLLGGMIFPDAVKFSAWTVEGSDYEAELQETFREGDRYVVMCSFDRQRTNVPAANGFATNYTRESLELGNWINEHNCPAVWNITDAPENYLELPEYAPLQEQMDILGTDLYTFDVVYTDDMSAIQRLHDNTLYIAEGRWLTPEDTANNAKVCVVDNILAIKYNLKLGDTLSLNLGHTLFEQFYTLGAIACAPERFAGEWTQDEFEIVGFYTGSTIAKDANEPNWAYSYNTVMVPLSSLPLTEAELEGHDFYPGEITFRVDNAWDIEGFLEESAPQIEAMGLTLDFDDGGWMEVLEGYRAAQRLPLIRIVLLAFVTVVGLALSVYLFVSRKKKDYAIMRALGTPKGRSAKALLAPLTVLTVAAVLFSVAAGTVYSRSVLDTVPVLPVPICIVGELAFTLLFAGLSIHNLSKKPPLLLLQGGRGKAKKAGKAAQGKISTPAPAKVINSVSAQVPPAAANVSPAAVRITAERPKPAKDPASLGFVLRYVRRHIRRQGFKSALAVLLAALMVGAVVQFASLRSTYNGLRETTVVTVQFTRSLSLNNLQPLVDEGFTRNVYYERNANISCLVGTEYEKAQLVITSDLDRYLGQDYEISLGDGYTMEDVGKMDYALLGVDFMAQHDLHPGDVVRFATADDFDRVINQYKSTYLYAEFYQMGLEPDRNPTMEELYEYYGEEIQRSLDRVGARAEVIGTIQTANGVYKDTVFTAGFDHVTSLVGTYQSMPLIEFTLSDNSRVEEMRQRAEEIINGRKGAFVMDTKALESVIRTSNLLNGLFPAAVALALLIGAALCALLVMQTTKDAAIMRAQGTTKRKTRAMLAVEQIILGVIGVLVGLVVMLAWKRGDFAVIALQAGLFAAGYVLVLVLGSFASAALATKKNILELLQTKE